jgi:hypothetical protein
MSPIQAKYNPIAHPSNLKSQLSKQTQQNDILIYYYYLKNNSQHDSGSPIKIQITGTLTSITREYFFGQHSNLHRIPSIFSGT